jgi:small neutral amino acid transporter SnatA (MarC family)
MDFLNSLYHWDAFAFFVQCFISLFVIVNPIGNVPIFVTLQRTRTQTGVEDEEHYREKDDLSIIPLGVPILAGPGAFTTGIVFFDTAASNLNRAIVIFSIFLVFFISHLVLVRSDVG